MIRLLSIVVWDLRLQFRHHFWFIGLLLTLLWLVILFNLSDAATTTWIPVIIFADIGSMGLLFIAGILYLERRQGTLYVAAIMPASLATWLVMKLLGLTLLTTACAMLIVSFSTDSVNWVRTIVAAALSGALFTSIGFVLAAPFDRILNYFLAMSLVLTLLNLPILAHLNIVSTGFMWLIPSYGALRLLAESSGSTSTFSFAATSLIVFSWVVLFHWVGTVSYRRLVSSRPQL
jgi:fluoroquinolone transport system permease protein